MKKRYLVLSSIAAGGVIGLAGLGIANAQTTTTGQSSLISKIAQKFNLKEADVQSVFDEQRASDQAAHQAEEKTQLDQAVKDGKLTQVQEDLIIAKQNELQSFMDSLADKTQMERRTAMDAKKVELDKWATDNNIPMQYMHFMGGREHGMGGPGGPRGNDGDADDAAGSTTAPSPSTSN
jgi:hypothetical protein